MNIKRKIFEFIVDCWTRFKFIPVRSELQKAFGGLTDDVDLHLEQLEREGLLTLTPGGGEEITIPTTYQHAPRLKLLRNRLNNSNPLPETTEAHSITLDLRGMGIAMKSNMYALVVHDESMIDAGIQCGDVAILYRENPRRGDIVAVELDGQKLLRRFVVVAGIPHFLAENPFQPDLIPSWELTTQGVLWGSIRIEHSHLVPDHARCKHVSYLRPNRIDLLCDASTYRTGRFSPTTSHQKSRQKGRAALTKRTPAKVKAEKIRAQNDLPIQDVWPKPPSGIELNDMAELEYKTSAPAVIDSAPEYCAALKAAIERYEKKKKAWNLRR